MIYKLVLALRNLMYDKGWKKSHEAHVPTVCVGNITVGGTGKTPHTEMILRKLLGSDSWGSRQLAVLSRGYKRKSHGFQVAGTDASARQMGDEPLQMARKFAEAINRHGGNATLVELPKLGIKGNTHFLMSDLNNGQLADLFGKWLHEQKLDK